MYNYSEETLAKIDDKMTQIEAALDLLESKLRSIPEGELPPEPQPSQIQNPAPNENASAVLNQQPASAPQANQDPNNKAEVKKEEMKKEETKKEEKKQNEEEIKEARRKELYQDEQVKAFAKMLKFGVPKPAILVKMKSLGYDTTILDVRIIILIRIENR